MAFPIHQACASSFIMATSASRHSSLAGLRRQQSSSPSDQLYRAKRQRWEARSDPSLVEDRPGSMSSSATSIGHSYGTGDENALDNLFASYPQTFSSLPHPHGSQGLHEPPWDLRFDHEIYIQNDFFRGERRCQLVRAPIPGPELDLFASKPPKSPPSAQQSRRGQGSSLYRQ